jgi:hypothetical protein
MHIENIWNQFIDLLSKHPSILHASYKKSAGIPFLYVEAKEFCSQQELEKTIKKAAAGAMKGKQLHCETEFVRNDKQLYVFRHRFYVPQRKMFCCGNLCPDCIRLKTWE